MHNYLQPLAETFKKNQNLEYSGQMKAYMKNRFEFFGIKSPLLKQLTKQFFAEYGLPKFEELEEIVNELFAQPQREFHYFAIESVGNAKFGRGKR